MDRWALVDELAGLIGLDPEPFTLGRLLTMAAGRRKEQWNHTAHLLAELSNGPRVRRDKKAWSAEHFSPHNHRSRETAPVKVTPQKFVGTLIRSLL